MLVILPPTQQTRRAELESIIDEHIQDFVRVVAALATIKQECLWVSSHESFEGFCKEKFARCKSYGYELAAAGRVVENLLRSGISDVELPSAVSQYRPLSKLTPDDQVEAWNAAQAIAPNPTAAQVVRAAEAVKTKAPVFEPGKTVTVLDEESPHYGQEVEIIDVAGVVVQARTENGSTVAFLNNELNSVRLNAEKVWAQKKPKSNPVESLAAELEIEKLRCEALEEKLGEAIALLGQFTAEAGVASWIAEAQALIA